MNRERSWTGTAATGLVLVLCPAAGVGQVDAEAEAEHAAAIGRIVNGLLSYRADYDLPSDGSAWGFVVGRFRKGDEKAVEFNAEVDKRYLLVGVGLDNADVDIRLFDSRGILIAEDVLDDAVPVVSFTAESGGTYRAVMSAAGVREGISYAGMAILQPPNSHEEG